MALYIGGRLLSIIPVLFGVSVLVFLLMHLAPGDITTTLLGPMTSPEAKEQIRLRLGLDRPLVVQYLIWLKLLLQGDFGTSWVHRHAVADIIFPKFLNTAILALASALIAYVIGFAAGILAAARSYSLTDRIVMGFVLILGSTPLYWLGLILVLIFALNLRWLPATGMTDIVDGGGVVDVLRHLILPSIASALPSAALVARVTRASMLEVLKQNYIRVARAKGISRRVILRKHALRNAAPPILTVGGMELGYLLGGVVFTEVVFAWPGIGNQLYQSIVGHDIPTVQGAVLLIAFAFVCINVAVDILNTYVEPRSRAAVMARHS
jgi:peptide/nickel transport system permease protein